MIILAINTASSHTGIALFDASKLLAKNSWQAHNDEAEKLMPAIAELLKKSGQKFSDIKQIYVIKGPGSFTGLRVGVTVANTLAYLNQCELFGITTFEYWHSVSDLPVVLYAGSGGVYLSLNKESEHQLIKLDELNDVLKEQKITEVSGDITPPQAEVIKANTLFFNSSKTFGEIIKIIIEKNLEPSHTALKSVKIIQPLYIKEPGVTQIKKTCST